MMHLKFHAIWRWVTIKVFVIWLISNGMTQLSPGQSSQFICRWCWMPSLDRLLGTNRFRSH